MSLKLQNIQNLHHIFLKAVESVKPLNLLTAANNYCLQPKQGIDATGRKQLTIQIQSRILDITNKRCHVVGFGKAVLGMAVQLECALAERLSSGVLSIPKGTLQRFRHMPDMQLQYQTRIQVYEGAANNQPDELALQAATRIKQVASTMTPDDILFVLISGGGSALLPMPRAPITLNEKMELVRRLSNAGATIAEMNVVRIALSDIKGGRLAAMARNAHAVISFVISDIVGDPVDLIASGPTCGMISKRSTAKAVLEKYNMWQNLPKHVQRVIETPVEAIETTPAANNAIYVVGDNRVATAEAMRSALECNYNPFIASTILQGDVQDIVLMYKHFLKAIQRYRQAEIDELVLKECFPFDVRIFQHFLKTLEKCTNTQRPLLLILAGEPTVKVEGSGLGGRNQELALRISLELYKDQDFENITFLSGGTDGIDGPTPAAGAIGDAMVIGDYLEQNATKTLEDIESYLKNSDSYNFYKELDCQCGKNYHIVTGHTGTNVMDLHLLLVP